MCGDDLLMVEPEGDNFQRNAGLEQMHGGGVPQSMWRKVGLLRAEHFFWALRSVSAKRRAALRRESGLPSRSEKIAWAEPILFSWHHF
jgi:hypothetical protein